MADAHKAIAKAIKAKGLQKLKYWCELCHKQCRDANGYKNHCTTDGHLRQVSLFSQSAGSFIDEYSQAFEKAFMELVRRRWRFKDILAKKAYNEYIQDKEHVHMNATRWVTLTEFAHHLGKAGLCEVKDTEEGLSLRYIDRDPQREAKQAAIREREREELEHREIERKRLLRQVKAMEDKNSNGPENSTSMPTASEESDPSPMVPSGPISFSLAAPKPSAQASSSAANSNTTPSSSASSSAPVLPIDSHSSTQEAEYSKKRLREEKAEDKEEEPFAKRSKLTTAATSASSSKLAYGSAPAPSKVPTSSTNSLDSIMEAQERRREVEGRKDYWLHPNIVVKILNKEVGHGQFYNQKGTVVEVEDKYLAKVRLENGTILKVDQDDLQTVLPALHSHVLIVNGAYRGETAVLQSINQDKYNTSVSILAGPARGRVLTKAYEDICKLVPH